uniref:Uncharacterized protein n=1 Tax=Podoviridae sp. ctZkC8 TaxID=2825259 RepID=A0A8S5UCE8_9CAUD|nr:MAG TPA: hypothetical protein [Podoviridae sp. ctZkC8]
MTRMLHLEPMLLVLPMQLLEQDLNLMYQA